MKKFSFFFFFLFFIKVQGQATFKVDYIKTQRYDHVDNEYQDVIRKINMDEIDRKIIDFKVIDSIAFIGKPNHTICLFADYDAEKDKIKATAEEKLLLKQWYASNDMKENYQYLTLEISDTCCYEKISPGIEMYTYQFGLSSFMSFCNYKNDLFIIYIEDEMRITFYCKDSKFNRKSIDIIERKLNLIKNDNPIHDNADYNDYGLWPITFIKDFIKFTLPETDDFNKIFKILLNSPYVSKDFIGYEYKLEMINEENENLNQKSRLVVAKSKNPKIKNIQIAHFMHSVELHYVAEELNLKKTFSASELANYQKNTLFINDSFLEKIKEDANK
jgi:hypothetical protein